MTFSSFGPAWPDDTADQPVLEEQTRSFIRYAIGFSLAGAAAYEASLIANGQGLAPRAVGLFTFVVIVIVAGLLMTRGRLRAAAWTLGLGVWLNLVASSYFFGGVNSPSGYMYPLIILLAGWQLGQRAALTLAGLTAVVLGAAALAESNGWLPAPPPTSASMRWVIEACVFACSAVLVGHIARNYRARLAEVRRLTADLARRSAELEASEADLHRAQAVAHVGSWVYDIAADRMRLSDETCRIFGLPAGVTGSHDSYLSRVHADDRAALARAWEATLRDGAPFDHEHRVHSGATVRWVRQRAEIERTADGRAHRAVGITQDISERRQREVDLAAARHQLAATLDAIPDLLFEVDLDGRLLDYRSPHREWLAMQPGEFLGRTIDDVLPPAAVATCRAGFAEALASGRSHGRSFELALPQGPHWFELSIARKPGEGTPRFITISRDITERKRAEAEVVELNATLETRVRERTAELQAANRELESFSYTISHDLRAPLRSIVGFSGVLEETLGERLDAQTRDYLERITASGHKMGRLIDRVLEYSRLARAPLAPVRTDLEALAREVVDELRDRHPATEVVIGELGCADVDPTMMRQILHNLIGNALKYSARSARPRIEVGRRADGDGYFVRDNGIGFDMAHAEHLFKLFTRLHSDPSIDSTGAGLAIVKRLVERHAGWIRAEAEPGRGATFSFGVRTPATA